MFPKNLFNSPDDLVKAVTEIMTGKAKKEALDPVDAKALKGSHADRKDKDIDNDGDVDSSDKYLHNRRKTIKKAMNEAKVKENEDEDDMEDDDDEKTDAQKNDLDGDGKNDKKKKKKKDDEKDDELSDKPDKIDTKPSMDDARTMMAKEEAELDEAIEVSHDRYMRSHGKKASGGQGSWMFTHKRMGDVDHKDMFHSKGKFADAAKAAKAWAKKNGHSTVYVMESVDLDEGFINIGGVKVKDDEKSILQHIKKTFPNVKKVRKDPQHGWIPVFEEVNLDEMSDVQMKKREEIVKSMKDKTADFKKRYGDRWKDVMYATATKQVMNEARGRPKKEDDVSSDSNFVMQMRKAISLNGNKVNFLDGSSSQVSSRDAQQFMTVYNKQKSSIDKGRLMKSAHKSLKHFKMAQQGKIEKSKNPLDLD